MINCALKQAWINTLISLYYFIKHVGKQWENEDKCISVAWYLTNTYKQQHFKVQRLLNWSSFFLTPASNLLVLVSGSSREASFFLSLAPAAGALRSLPARPWRLCEFRKLSADVEVSSSFWGRSLISVSFRSHTSAVTPGRRQTVVADTVPDILHLITMKHLKNSPIPEAITSPSGLNLLTCQPNIQSY